MVIITGHIDSRVTDPMNATADAPGANDDGSGTAAVIEAARVLSRHRFPATIVYAALSGEEQGLVGGQDPRRLCPGAGLAGGRQSQQRHRRQFSCGSDGVCDDAMSGSSRKGCAGRAARRCAPLVRSQGGENDSPSRNLSRFLDDAGGRAQPRPRRPPDLAQRPLRARRRPYRVSERRLPGGALLGRGRELQLAAPGSAGPRTASSMATRSTGWTFPICGG